MKPQTIEGIRATDAKLGQLVGIKYESVPEAMKGTCFEQSSYVLTSLVKALFLLKTSILELAASENLYGTLALFRVFLEHQLRVMAIFLKAVDEGSDDFANQFLRLRILEALRYLRALEDAHIELSAAPKTILDQWIPEAQAMTNAQINDLERAFRYKSLIQSIRSLLGVPSPDFLSKIIPNYSELSGFVHGGPSALAKHESILAEGLSGEELCRVAELTVEMSFSAQRWLLVLASEKTPEFGPCYNRLNQALGGTFDEIPEGPSGDPK